MRELVQGPSRYPVFCVARISMRRWLEEPRNTSRKSFFSSSNAPSTKTSILVQQLVGCVAMISASGQQIVL